MKKKSRGQLVCQHLENLSTGYRKYERSPGEWVLLDEFEEEITSS